MKEISVFQMGACVEEALKTKKKNILFVSPTLEYENALEWIRQSNEYHEYRFATPVQLYDNVDGRMVAVENYYIIPDDRLKNLNNENVVLLVEQFSPKVIYDFEGFLNVVKHRYYINRIPNHPDMKHTVEKLPLLVACATPPNRDFYSLDEKYYDLFDEVYYVI